MVEIEPGHCYIGSLNSQGMITFMITAGSLNSQDMIRIYQVNIYVMDIVWILFDVYVGRSKFMVL